MRICSLGEEAILRQRAATGGLRSGGTQEALAQHAGGLQQQIYQEKVAGLAGLAELPGFSREIASGMTGIGETLASGQLAQQQAREAEKAQMLQLGMTAYKELGGWEGISEGIGDAWNWAGEATGWW